MIMGLPPVRVRHWEGATLPVGYDVTLIDHARPEEDYPGFTEIVYAPDAAAAGELAARQNPGCEVVHVERHA